MFTGSSCSVDMIYLDFSQSFDKVDHGVPLHKLRGMGIAGNLGIWFHSFVSNCYHFMRLPGGSSTASSVIIIIMHLYSAKAVLQRKLVLLFV